MSHVPADTESLYSVASAGSVYSNAGGIAPHLDISGEILLSMMYDVSTKTFILHLHKAKGINCFLQFFFGLSLLLIHDRFTLNLLLHRIIYQNCVEVMKWCTRRNSDKKTKIKKK